MSIKSFLVSALSVLFVCATSAQTRTSSPDWSGELYNGASERLEKGWLQNRLSNASAPGTKELKFMDDFSITGLPLVAAGLAVRGERTSFRQDYSAVNGAKGRLLTSFKTHIDDYTQLGPVALATGLNLLGYEGRSSTPRYLASAGLSYAVMIALVNSVKYSVKEMRPDGSTRNSFPSGHTATAFTGATILHKEYGMTRSPWFSIGGYGLATATGIMRVLNNRHWVSDVFAGAGIGILSTELGYGLADLIFKERGLRRNTLPGLGNAIYDPTFFSLSMGMGFGNSSLSFDVSEMGLVEVGEDGVEDHTLDLTFRPSTMVGVEGAYFFNTYVGVGGRLRVVATPVSGWDGLMRRIQNDYAELADGLGVQTESMPLDDGISAWHDAFSNVALTMESDHLTEFSADMGLYFNLPLSQRLALASKVLVGRSIYQALAVSYTASGESFMLNLEDDADGTDLLIRTGDFYDVSGDFVNVSANNTMKYGSGLSLVLALKDNMVWRIFADWDCARKTYTLEYNDLELLSAMSPDLFGDLPRRDVTEITKTRHNFTIGASFQVSF